MADDITVTVVDGVATITRAGVEEKTTTLAKVDEDLATADRQIAEHQTRRAALADLRQLIVEAMGQ